MEDEKKTRKQFYKKNQTTTEKIEKRLLPGSGETDCSRVGLV